MRNYIVTVIVNETKLGTVAELLAPEGRITIRRLEDDGRAASPTASDAPRTPVRVKRRMIHPFATKGGTGVITVLRAVAKALPYAGIQAAYMDAGKRGKGASPALSKLIKRGLVYRPEPRVYRLTRKGEEHLRRIDAKEVTHVQS
jgi:hypothetical protein